MLVRTCPAQPQMWCLGLRPRGPRREPGAGPRDGAFAASKPGPGGAGSGWGPGLPRPPGPHPSVRRELRGEVPASCPAPRRVRGLGTARVTRPRTAAPAWDQGAEMPAPGGLLPAHRLRGAVGSPAPGRGWRNLLVGARSLTEPDPCSHCPDGHGCQLTRRWF